MGDDVCLFWLLQKAEQIHMKVMSKYRQNKEVWISYMKHTMEDGRFDDAHQLLKRCVQCLEKKIRE